MTAPDKHIEFRVQRRIPGLKVDGASHPRVRQLRRWHDFGTPTATIAEAREQIDETMVVYGQPTEWRIVKAITVFELVHEETGI